MHIGSTAITYMKEHVGIGKRLGARKTHRRHLAVCSRLVGGALLLGIPRSARALLRPSCDVIVNKWRDKQTMAEAEVNKLVSEVS